MKLTVRKIGNSLGVIVPKERLRDWGVSEGGHLELTAHAIHPPTRRAGSTHAKLDTLKRGIALEVIARHSPAEIRQRSLANLERWKRAGVWCGAYDEWRDIARANDDGELFAAMLGQDDRANRIRQSMPFVGMLPANVLARLREEAAR
jgi:antitoxin component of MazEF toxin-antitoxin module